MLSVLKRTTCVIAVMMLSLILSSCAKDQLTPMEEIQNQLSTMENCQAKGTLTRISNKGEMTYEIAQCSKITGEYRLEILAPEHMSGNFTVYNGNEVSQYNSRTNELVKLDIPNGKQGSELFFTSFVKNYLKSENVSITTSVNLDENSCTVLEAVIPGGNKYIATEKAWIDNETLKPLKFVIYDEEGKERYIIIYNEFEYNLDLDNSIFEA